MIRKTVPVEFQLNSVLARVVLLMVKIQSLLALNAVGEITTLRGKLDQTSAVGMPLRDNHWHYVQAVSRPSTARKRNLCDFVIKQYNSALFGDIGRNMRPSCPLDSYKI